MVRASFTFVNLNETSIDHVHVAQYMAADLVPVRAFAEIQSNRLHKCAEKPVKLQRVCVVVHNSHEIHTDRRTPTPFVISLSLVFDTARRFLSCFAIACVPDPV